MFLLNVSTLSIGQEHRVTIPAIHFSVPEPSITLKELIRNTVTHQIMLLSESFEEDIIADKVNKQYLSESDVSRLASEGKIVINHGDHSKDFLTVAIEKAISGFEKGRYKIFIAGQDTLGLDTNITLSKTTDVKFLRLLPLIGG
ncbi:hypothetical protein KO489_11025 [Reinekea forsetii]|nr:hypothetical protein [Reinekea forsetii]